LVWRCILERIATLQEIETHWSLIDLMDANDVLDARDNATDKANNEAKNARGKK